MARRGVLGATVSERQEEVRKNERRWVRAERESLVRVCVRDRKKDSVLLLERMNNSMSLRVLCTSKAESERTTPISAPHSSLNSFFFHFSLFPILNHNNKLQNSRFKRCVVLAVNTVMQDAFNANLH